jgi:hypothetical protein
MAEQMFGNPGDTRPITMIVEAKQVDDNLKDYQYSNILTKEAFQEIIDFENEVLYGARLSSEEFPIIKESQNGRTQVGLSDLC